MILTMLLAASAAIAPGYQDASPAPQDSVVVTAEQNKKNKRVCKRSTPTGSVMQKVTCRTLGEWEAEDLRNRTAADRMRGDQRWSDAARSEKALLPD